ncbi:MAG: tripartite tricarboxylate transporter substrate binding protein [Burkholderiales bacterium]|nr:tripartite tricarboxylate transporter substrate binding protein [Burkholderiales bacterium]
MHTMLTRRRFVASGTALAVGAGVGPALGQSAAWPTRPVRMLVPFPPGGGADFIARMLGQKLAEIWGQQVLVDNRPGASTMIAHEAVAKAAPDGYTLILAVSNHASNPALFSKIPYDTVKDFTPITVVGSAPMVLVVNPRLQARTLQELLAAMREKPGRMSYASAGNGSVGHLGGELLKQLTGVDMVHIAYKGTGPAELDLIGGTVDLMFTGMVTAVPQIKAGKMRGVAVGSLMRSSALPELPSISEAGVPGFESSIWYGLLGPAGLPREIVAKVHADTLKVLQLPDTRSRLLSQGAEAIGSTPEQFARQIEAEIARWIKLVKAAGIKSE